MDMKVVIKSWALLMLLAYASWMIEAQSIETQSTATVNYNSKVDKASSGFRTKRRKIKRPQLFMTGSSANTTIANKDSRFLSVFTVVQFDNNLCMSTSGENGTCVASAKCSSRGGVASGSCAKDFGVCCLFMATCSMTTSQNCTYFVNPNYPQGYDGTGSCQLTIQKAHPDVCQYRLDFNEFKLTGPETVNNICNNDQFIVSGGNPIPAICGNNQGNHMYVDAGVGATNPVTLTVVTSGPSMTRNWKIKVCQIPCSSNYRAEEGCLQYFTGVSGQIKSYNYDTATSPNSGLQLSNQDYSACVRIERNFCGIQYTPCVDNSNNRSKAFTLSGNTQGTNIANSAVGSTGVNGCNSDWIIIPCAQNVGRVSTSPATCVDRICGGTFNTEVSTTDVTVYSIVKPFRIAVHTDNVESPNDVGNRGFCLNYVQQPCTNRLQ